VLLRPSPISAYCFFILVKTPSSAPFLPDSLLEGAGFEPSVHRESNGEKAKEPVSLVERKVPEMSSTGRRLSIFTSGFSRD
jgi:hypothetical protein